MIHLKWTQAMTVEVDELDEDHRVAIAIMSDLRDRIAAREAGPALRAFDDLLRLSRVHFAREERMLAECGFPLLAKHIQGHRAAEAELLALLPAIAGGDWPRAESRLETCGETFLFRLILDDLDYKLFLQDKGTIPRFSGTGIAEWLPRESASAAAEPEPQGA